MLLGQGNELSVAGGLQGGRQYLVEHELPQRNIAAAIVACDKDSILPTITSETRVIMVESPTKPRLEVSDHEKIAAEANKQGISGIHR